ncbi:MAG TPA: NAD(P)H-dependent oxidoreductase [Steroidobacteraceae bacterium]|jgi:FMN reductase|nr:NAD(P)H-dependent oxidoreductase [Steroidobacteraceae bacterium]
MGSSYIVAVGGTLRANSSTERAIQHVLAAAERAGARTKLISGSALQLPLYQPDNPHRSDAALSLVAELALADGIVLGSPGYHGSISGLVKNALDYAEDLRADPRPYFSGRAVGCIATAGGWPAAVNTLGALRDIVHALRGWPTPLGAAINSAERVFDDHGSCTIPRVAQILDTMAAEVMEFAMRTQR